MRGKNEKPDDALKIRIAEIVAAAIDEIGLTQTQAAKRLDLKQPDVSDLKRGKIKRFSTPHLLEMASAMGCDLEIAVSSTRRPSGAGRLRVLGG
jgi:predicted XRE-type DNA-binding protein